MRFDMKEIFLKEKKEIALNNPLQHPVRQNVHLPSLSIAGKSCLVASIHRHPHL
jgi:hypothetical protein